MQYSNVVFAGNVVIWTLNALSSAIRGTGNMLVPAVVICVGVVVLVPLSPCLIFGIGHLPALGIAGGGVAMVLYNAAGTAVLAWYVLSGRNLARLRPARLRWPLPQARSVKYFLHSQGKANSLRGNGSLSTSAPKSEPPDSYVYDPGNPVPTIGGPLCCAQELMEPGPRDQRSVENRDDVLVYSIGPLAQNLEVTGPVSATLFVKSSAVDTDFTGKLTDVAPDGVAMDVAEGILRMRYRDSKEHVLLMNPGQTYQITLDLWSTSNVFLRGHTLRLEISSSNFPRFDRNLNTGEDIKFARRFVSATNTIFHDAQHPSALVLPVIP